MSSGPVAVIDVGSNSIKLLVAVSGAGGTILPLAAHTVEARISAGISRTKPRLSESGMGRGIQAISTLLAAAQPFGASRVLLVATSAVRDAENGAEFRERVRAATGHELRILSGEEEAGLIGRGLTADPTLRALRDFYVCDLGGGSLECLAFRNRRLQQVATFQLGCVRLTEKFVADPAQPITAAALQQIQDHTRDVLACSGFTFSLSSRAVGVGTGGTVMTVRAIIGPSAGRGLDESNPEITVTQLRELLARLAALPLAERQQVRGLPAARADIFPAALATLIALAAAGGFSTYRISSYNLRFGLAEEALQQTK